MDLTIQNILLVLAFVSVSVAYLTAGIIACDRFSDRSRKINHLLTNNEFCFAFTVFLWPIVWFLSALYLHLLGCFQTKKTEALNK